MSYRNITSEDIDNRDVLLEDVKNIYVPIHDTVAVSLMATLFIDTKLFQKLRKQKQLGTCDYVYPSAVHTRFEHSIATYYLGGKITERIKFLFDTSNNIDNDWLNDIEELYNNDLNKIDDNVQFSRWIMELIKIAALMHDVGHGPYSHAFDDIFIKNSELCDHEMALHEARSCIIVEHIIKNNDILNKFMTDYDIKFIQNLIDPPEGSNGFIYQIVSNTLNGLDIDKYDYLCRDRHHIGLDPSFNHMRLIENIMIIDNKIVYPDKSKNDIYNMFQTRHTMHRIAYGHKGVVSAQYIVTEIMEIIDKVINITESITNIEQFAKMTDEYIDQTARFIVENKDNFKDVYTDEELENLTELVDRLDNHYLYVHIGTFITKNEPYMKPFRNRFNTDEYKFYISKIGLVSGNKGNPLDSVYVYKNKDILNTILNPDEITNTIIKLDKTDITNLMPDIHQEHVLMIYKVNTNDIAKDKTDFTEIKNELKLHFK